VIAAVAVRRESPTDVAVIIALPAATPRTTTLAPLGVIVATAAFDVVQVTSVDAPPNAVTVAVNVAVPAGAIDAVGGLTATAETPVTETLALALFDASADDVAVMVAVPADTPVIVAVLPFGVTDTTAALDVDHETDCDAPFVTATVAVSVAV